MGGGGSQQQQVSKVELPAWVEKASGQNYQFAQQVANQPYQAYTGQTVAGMSPDQLSAMNYARNNVGAYQGVYDNSINMANQVGNATPQQMQSAVNSYMNPYLDQVEGNALRNLQGATQLSVNKIGDQAVAARAFGGSRQGIAEGVTIAEGAKNAGDLSANIRAAGYDKALGQYNTDQARKLNAATAMAGYADQGRNAIGQDVQRMMTLGQMQQAQEQRYLDDAYNRFTEARDYPKEQLNILLSALGMSPYGKTQTTTQNSPTNWGGVASGVGSTILGLAMMSDEDMKTDVQKVGKDKDTGLDVYSYRYKGDPKTYPKVVGLMADDIEEKMPGATQEVAGKKAVKFNPAVPKNRIKKA